MLFVIALVETDALIKKGLKLVLERTLKSFAYFVETDALIKKGLKLSKLQYLASRERRQVETDALIKKGLKLKLS